MYKTTYESNLGVIGIQFQTEGRVRAVTAAYSDIEDVAQSVKAGRTEVEFLMILEPSPQNATGFRYIDRHVYRSQEGIHNYRDVPEGASAVIASLATEIWDWSHTRPDLFKLAEINNLETESNHHKNKSLDYRRLAREEIRFAQEKMDEALRLRAEAKDEEFKRGWSF